MASERKWLTLGVIVFLAYVAFLCTLTYLPFLDLPNHATRAFIIGELLQNSKLNELFSFNLTFQPYILGDLVFAYILRIFPLYGGAVFWNVVLFATSTIALLLYLISRKESSDTVLLIFLLSPFIQTNYFYLSGYVNFSFGMMLAFVTLSTWEYFTRNKPTFWHYTLYLSLTALVYAAHLAPFLFVGMIVAMGAMIRWLQKRLSFKTVILSIIPFTMLGIYHVTEHLHAGYSGTKWEQRDLLEKVGALDALFIRYNYSIDIIFSLVFLTIVILPIYRHRKGLVIKPASLELGAIFVLILLAYIILPKDLGASDVDIRATPFLLVTGLLFIGSLLPRSGFSATQIKATCTGISICNLLYLGCYLIPENSHIERYTSALSTIPADQRVLGVATKPPLGRLQINVHNTETYMADKRGFVPYLFSSNTAGEQLGYFSYIKSYPAPSSFWYVRNESINWQEVEDFYNYVIVEKPFELSRINIPNSDLTYENSSAAIYRVKLHSP